MDDLNLIFLGRWSSLIQILIDSELTWNYQLSFCKKIKWGSKINLKSFDGILLSSLLFFSSLLPPPLSLSLSLSLFFLSLTSLSHSLSLALLSLPLSLFLCAVLQAFCRTFEMLLQKTHEILQEEFILFNITFIYQILNLSLINKNLNWFHSSNDAFRKNKHYS